MVSSKYLWLRQQKWHSPMIYTHFNLLPASISLFSQIPLLTVWPKMDDYCYTSNHRTQFDKGLVRCWETQGWVEDLDERGGQKARLRWARGANVERWTFREYTNYKNTHEQVERLGNNKAESIIRAHMCSSELYNCAVEDNRNSDRWVVWQTDWTHYSRGAGADLSTQQRHTLPCTTAVPGARRDMNTGAH